MTHLKLYEEYENSIEPEVGDYIFAKWKHAEDEHPANIFATNNIGELIKIETDKYDETSFLVKYNNIPDELKLYKSMNNDTSFRFKKEDLIKWTKNKEELETILQANKFNL